MREFVFGTEQQYKMLRDTLEDHLCHVYRNCRLPSSCSLEMCRIGFEKEGDTYALFIDKGITCSCSNVSGLFTDWIQSGTLRFLDFTDMKEFLRSLKYLY